MTTILAPHVDDELIGCFTRLQNRSIDHVIYFFELTPERKKEAKAAAEHFGFIPIFARPDSMKLVMDTVKTTQSCCLLAPIHTRTTSTSTGASATNSNGSSSTQ